MSASDQTRSGLRIAGVCGSLQARSANRALLDAAVRSAPEGVAIGIFQGLRDMPPFDPDLEETGPLSSVQAWRRALAESDGVLIASPEYGHSLPGALKNAIDWVIGTGELERKIVAITAAVPHPERGRRGLAALASTLAAVNARLVGGAPIVRGASFAADVEALVRDLVRTIEGGGAARDQPPISLEIAHVQLAAPPGSEAAARRFFGGLLGLVEIPKPGALATRGGVWFQCGAQQLHLGIERDFRAAKKAHPALRVAHAHALTALAARLREAGIRVQDDQELEGEPRFYVDDPWGNRIEVLAPKSE